METKVITLVVNVEISKDNLHEYFCTTEKEIGEYFESKLKGKKESEYFHEVVMEMINDPKKHGMLLYFAGIGFDETFKHYIEYSTRKKVKGLLGDIIKDIRNKNNGGKENGENDDEKNG